MIARLSFFTFSEFFLLILKSYYKPLVLQAHLSSTIELSGEGKGCSRLEHFENPRKHFCKRSGLSLGSREGIN